MPAASMRCRMRRTAWAGSGRLAQGMSESSGSDPALSQSLSENRGLRMIVPPVEPVILDDFHAFQTGTARGPFDRTALEVPFASGGSIHQQRNRRARNWQFRSLVVERPIEFR